MLKPSVALDIKQKKQQPHQDVFFNKKIVAPQKLKILVLSGNDIISQQLEFLHKCTNLLKLDLSNNHITKITQKIGMDKLTKLQILYLHKNRIENAASLEGVFMLNKLTHLTIRDNPVESLPRIEHLIINVMPSLKVIGERIIFVEERSPEFFQARPNVFIESQISEGWRVKDNSEAHYIKILQLQLKYFDNVWARSNPIILIQRAWKIALVEKRNQRVYQRRKLKKEYQSKQLSSEPSQVFNKLREFFNQWKKFAQNRKSVKHQLKKTSTFPEDKSYLTYPLNEYFLSARNFKVATVLKNYLKYIRNKIFLRKMSERVYRQLKKKSIQFNSPESFYTLCKIDITHRFFFNKIQTHLLENFLAHLKQNFDWARDLHQHTSIGPVTSYLSIRTVDPQAFSVKTIHSTFTYSMWPSMRAIFVKRKKFQSKHKTGIIKIRPLIYIKNHNKVLTKQQYKKSCKVYKQLQKFYKKQYENSLDYFECKNQDVMKMLIRYIYYHNSKTKKFQKKLNKNDMQSLLQNYDEPFMIYADCLLERTAAAVRIQQNWRKYVVQKSSKQSIYVKMKKTRAALRIQRFWRDNVFYHRLSFQKNIAYQLKVFNTNSFMIPSELYLKFKDFCREQTENQLYQGLTLTKSEAKNSLNPFWVLTKPVFSPSIAKAHFPSVIEQQEQSTNFCTNWNILHLGSSITKIQYSGEQFYEFTFNSSDEARYRIFLMALFSYRCKRSTYFLPLSRDTLDLFDIRFQQYEKMGLLKRTGNKTITNLDKKAKSKTFLKIKEDKFTNSIQKISLLKVLKQNGVFFSSKTTNLQQPIKYPINIEFYQKVYQDFPKKYIGELYYSLTDEIQQEKLLQKQKIVEDLVQENYLQNQEVLEAETQRKQARSSIQGRKQQIYLNISKIDRKRLSFYDLGGTTDVLKNQQKPKTRGEFFYEQAFNKKENISRIKVQQNTRKQQNVQKRTQNLKKIRQDMEKQRLMNATAKNLKQFQRSQQLKKKIQKVKQMKSRASSLRKQEHEDDFIQQGNFVMEQQLKMVIMRSKMQSIKPRIKQREKSESSSKKHSDSYSKSFYTEQKNKEIKVYQNPNVKPAPYGLGTTLNLANSNEPSIAGEQKKIVNIRSQKRNKSRSIGAYLRDPSLVHGVFPEEYYPIQSKDGGGNFKFFPPLL